MKSKAGIVVDATPEKRIGESKVVVRVTPEKRGGKTIKLREFRADFSEALRQSFYAEGVKVSKSGWNRLERRITKHKTRPKRLAQAY